MNEIIVKLKTLHPNQQKIVDEALRYNVLKCGRRFGKTELVKELCIQPALDGFPVGVWYPTYKDLYEVWNEVKYTVMDIIESKDEQVKQIKLITGGKIDFWSMEDPNSGRGRKYKRAIMDEAEKAKKIDEAWTQTIRATLTDFRGDAWFMSTPKFGPTYFKELFQLGQGKNTEWKSWKFTTYDNPYIDPEEVDSARRTLDNLTFDCEYMAEDVDLNLFRFAHAYDRDKHLGKCEPDRRHDLWLSFDFNKNPITCTAIQHYNNTIYIPRVIKLQSSDIYKLCAAIRTYFPNYLYMVTGDATGKNESAMVRDNLNYYKIIRSELNLSNGQIRVPTVNPPLSENGVLLNSLLANYKWCIDETNASDVDYDFMNVRCLPDGSIEKGDRRDPKKQADVLDTVRYWCNVNMKWFLNMK